MEEARIGPDFTCIGMPLSGTRWLYDNLQAHSDVEMPLIKELHFLDRGVRSRTLQNRLNRIAERDKASLPVDANHRVFIERYAKASVTPGLLEAEKAFLQAWKHGGALETPFQPTASHFDWYESLFESYKPKSTGDITPGYWRVGSSAIGDYHARYPQVRYLAMIRHPVQRIVSLLNKQVNNGIVSLEQAEQLITNPQISKMDGLDGQITLDFRAKASQVIKKWADIVGRDAIMTVTLDDVAKEPEQVRSDIYRFVGLSNDPLKVDTTMIGNRKENRFPKLLSHVDTSTLYRCLQEEIEDCKALVGGATLNW